MSKSILKLCVISAITLGVSASPAFAKNGNGYDKDKHQVEDRDHHHYDHDRDRDHHHYDHDRDRVRHSASSRPPGWDKGKKTGWGNCDVPPGQAKKYGCHSGSREHHVVAHRNVSHHDRDYRYVHHDTHTANRAPVVAPTRPVVVRQPTASASGSVSASGPTVRTTRSTRTGVSVDRRREDLLGQRK